MKNNHPCFNKGLTGDDVILTFLAFDIEIRHYKEQRKSILIHLIFIKLVHLDSAEE